MMIDQTEEEILKDIAHYSQKGDRWGETTAFGLLGTKYKEQRKLQKAVDAWLEDVRIRQALRDTDGAASTLFAIANVYWAKPNNPLYPGLGDINRAISYAEQAVALDSRKESKAWYLVELAFMYALSGNLHRAIQCIDLSEANDVRNAEDREYRLKQIKDFVALGYENW